MPRILDRAKRTSLRWARTIITISSKDTASSSELMTGVADIARTLKNVNASSGTERS